MKLHSRIFRFGTVGVLGAVVQLGFVSLFDWLGWIPLISLLAALFFTKNFNFLTTRTFTFPERRSQPFFTQYKRYWLSSGGATLVNYLVSVGISHSLEIAYDYPQIGAFAGIAVAALFNFFVYQFWVFRKE